MQIGWPFDRDGRSRRWCPAGIPSGGLANWRTGRVDSRGADEQVKSQMGMADMRR